VFYQSISPASLPLSTLLTSKKENNHMVKTEQRAEATWEGNLLKGQGRVRSRSGAFGDFPLTWASRTEPSAGKTSPEEMIAAAHAGCYSMALSQTLAQAGQTAEQLIVNATCTFEQIEGNLKITTMTLNVEGKVPGLDPAGFSQAALRAEQNCPISNAMRNNVVILVNAYLQQE
jgi:lipoyl-dependent peroxiredoxin